MLANGSAVSIIPARPSVLTPEYPPHMADHPDDLTDAVPTGDDAGDGEIPDLEVEIEPDLGAGAIDDEDVLDEALVLDDVLDDGDDTDIDPDIDLDDLDIVDSEVIVDDDEADEVDEVVDQVDEVDEVDDLVVDVVAGTVAPANKAATAAAPTRRATDDEADEDDEDDVDPDDVEADLDTILRDRIAADAEEDDEDEETPETEQPGDGTKIVPRRPGEFLCQSCFLVKHPSQLADETAMLCLDCV